MWNDKSVPPLDFTYVCIIIGGTIKNIKIKFIYGGGPSYTAKTVRNWTESDLHG